MRTDFLSIIAHELRTPITVMRTLTGLLLDPASDPTPEQRRTMLETMERNAERMQHVIGEMLDLARYRAGTIGLQLRPFDATELAESAVTTIRPLAERRDQTVVLRLPPGPAPRVYGDRPRLDRALLNLVANAHHFAPDGGRITVAVKRTDDGMIRWSVTDDGPGISAADQAHLFEQFFVGRHDPNAPQEGVGLGLPRALAIAQAHGGSIEVRSRPGHGSHLHPCRPVRRTTRGDVMKILVVDDEPDVVESVRLGFTLQWRDVDVLGAGDGEAALDIVEREHPDIVLLDVGLPGIDGYEVLRQIRAFSDVPVVMLTARDDAMDKVKGLELGADDYVTKPFNHLELMARVKAVLRRLEMPPPTSRAPSFKSGDLEVDFAKQEARLDGNRLDLTPTEYKLLYHLVRNAGHILEHGTLLAKVWGREYVDEVDYIRVYIRRLRDKLGDSSDAPRYIRTERGLGYRFIAPST